MTTAYTQAKEPTSEGVNMPVRIPKRSRNGKAIAQIVSLIPSAISLTEARFSPFGFIAPEPCGDRDRNHHHHHHDDPDDETGREKLTATRHFTDRAVNDDADPGRYGRGDETRKTDDVGSIALGIAPFDHVRSQDPRLHGGVGYRRTGDSAHQGAQDDRDLGEPSPHVTGKKVG